MAKLPTLKPQIPVLGPALQAQPVSAPGTSRHDRDTGKGRKYDTRAWRDSIRPQKLRRNPLCEECALSNVVTIAIDVDHVDGDSSNDRPENLRSLCKRCHSIKTAREDGRPGRYLRELFWPTIINAPALPVTVVCGPPAAGKSTYITKHRGAHDVVIDLDDIVEEQTGIRRAIDEDARRRGLAERNRRLQALATYRGNAQRAWFATTAPRPQERIRWAAMLHATVIVLATPLHECRARVRRDQHRNEGSVWQDRIIDRWWRQYEPCSVDTAP